MYVLLLYYYYYYYILTQPARSIPKNILVDLFAENMSQIDLLVAIYSKKTTLNIEHGITMYNQPDIEFKISCVEGKTGCRLYN